MRFGPIATEAAAGSVLVHALALPGGRVLKKGRVLSPADITHIAAAGIAELVVATLAPDEIGEDSAAEQVAAALLGAGVTASAPFTGRVNLFAQTAGILQLDPVAIDAANRVDEAVTIATLPAWHVVAAGQMLGTVKIIPYAVPGAVMQAVLASLHGKIAVAAFHPADDPLPVALIHTTLPQTKPGAISKMRSVTAARLAPLGGAITYEADCPHTVTALSDILRRAIGEHPKIILIAGASAIADRRDVIPRAIEAVGGTVLQLGMPVDPGNLILLGRVGAIWVIGLPGCARSPKFNGADLVLQRLLAGISVDAAAIRSMGVGGLLADIPRPLPRAAAGRPPLPHAPHIAALLLAAGLGRRMGAGMPKLLRPLNGKPLLRHAAETLVKADLTPRIIVVGTHKIDIDSIVMDLKYTCVENLDPSMGMASSLAVGLRALPAQIDGVLIALGDMPHVQERTLRRLLAAFAPAEGRAICVPVCQGQRGNPILWDAALIPDMLALSGDQGARSLLLRHADRICEIEVDDPGVLLDIDTPEALAAAEGKST